MALLANGLLAVRPECADTMPQGLAILRDHHMQGFFLKVVGIIRCF